MSGGGGGGGGGIDNELEEYLKQQKQASAVKRQGSNFYDDPSALGLGGGPAGSGFDFDNSEIVVASTSVVQPPVQN